MTTGRNTPTRRSASAHSAPVSARRTAAYAPVDSRRVRRNHQRKIRRRLIALAVLVAALVLIITPIVVFAVPSMQASAQLKDYWAIAGEQGKLYDYYIGPVQEQAATGDAQAQERLTAALAAGTAGTQAKQISIPIKLAGGSVKLMQVSQCPPLQTVEVALITSNVHFVEGGKSQWMPVLCDASGAILMTDSTAQDPGGIGGQKRMVLLQFNGVTGSWENLYIQFVHVATGEATTPIALTAEG